MLHACVRPHVCMPLPLDSKIRAPFLLICTGLGRRITTLGTTTTLQFSSSLGGPLYIYMGSDPLWLWSCVVYPHNFDEVKLSTRHSRFILDNGHHPGLYTPTGHCGIVRDVTVRVITIRCYFDGSQYCWLNAIFLDPQCLVVNFFCLPTIALLIQLQVYGSTWYLYSRT